MCLTVTYPTVKMGSHGEIVTQLQVFLVNSGSKIFIDGSFGLGTRNAVRAFQKRYQIPVTGVADAKTWTKLMEIVGNIKVSKPAEKKVTLQIPNLTEKEANDLLTKYPKAIRV